MARQEKTRTTHDDLAVYLDIRRWRRDSIGDRITNTLKVGFVRIDEQHGSPTAPFAVRNPDTYDIHQQAYNELCVQGYCSVSLDGLQTYGMEAVYDDPFTVDLRRAEFMLKTLRQINRGLAHEDLSPRTFGEFCQAVAKILRIDRFVVRTDEGRSCSYDDMTFAYYHRHDIRNVVDAKVKEFIQGQAVSA